MSTSPPRIGDRVREARALVDGLLPSELSDIAGLATSHVGMIERGTVVNPSVPVLAKIAKALGVSVEWLATGTGDAPDAETVRSAVDAARAAHAPADPPAPTDSQPGQS